MSIQQEQRREHYQQLNETPYAGEQEASWQYIFYCLIFAAAVALAVAMYNGARPDGRYARSIPPLDRLAVPYEGRGLPARTMMHEQQKINGPVQNPGVNEHR